MTENETLASAKWQYEGNWPPDADNTVRADLFLPDGTHLAACLWDKGELDIEGDTLGVTREGAAYGLTADGLEWPDEDDALDAAYGKGVRLFDLCEDSHWYGEHVGCIEQALAKAEANVDRSNYDCADPTRALFVEVRVRLASDPRNRLWWGSATVVLDGEEPECSHEDGHDWTDERVHGHGGGVVITERCRHCGAGKRVDTWAQNPEDGSQGHHVLEYDEPGTHDVDEVA